MDDRSTETVYSNSLMLRAIGQALEQKHVEDFELKSEEGEFSVRARQGLPEGGEELVRDIMRRLRRQGGFSEFRYTYDDVNRLDAEGRAKRREQRGMPDFYTLSQTLRTVGAYVDEKGADLLGVSRTESRVTIQYKIGQGQLTLETHDTTSLYKFFTELYLHRGGDRSSETSS
jgi:hypothetical protein